MTRRDAAGHQTNSWLLLIGSGLVAIILLASFLVVRLSATGPDSIVEDEDAGQRCDGTSPATQLEPPEISIPGARFMVDFDDSIPGTYTEADLVEDWNDPPWSNGVDDGRVTIIARGETDNVLRVIYPGGEFGANGSGTQWQGQTDEMDAAYVRYLVRFVGDFDFVRGGKLPGFAGGEANTGGNTPTGSDGWSARMMWRENGCAVFYLYHPDQPGEFGEDIGWGVAFEPDRWHVVEHLVVMNEPGDNNGVMLGWLDGQLVADRRDIRFRDVDTFAIDMLYISTFFGGGSASWAPDNEQFIEFDQFEVAEVEASTLEIMGLQPNG